MRRRAIRWLGLVVTLSVLATGCSVLGATTGYRLSATFPRAVGLFEQSRVKLMGLNVGIVESLELVDGGIRATLLINQEVPLPDDVNAAIVALSLIGERNIVLSPAWKPGDDRIHDGAVISPDRITVPAETDEIVQAFLDGAEAIDAEKFGEFIRDSAKTVEGRGESFNAVLASAADLAEVFADQDDELLAMARDLHQLARTLNSREAQLGRLLDGYSEAVSVLADERQAIRTTLANTVRLLDVSNELFTEVEPTIASDLALMADLSLRVEANIESVQDFILVLPDIADVVVNAYHPEYHALAFRISQDSSATFVNAIGLANVMGVAALACFAGDPACPGATS